MVLIFQIIIPFSLLLESIRVTEINKNEILNQYSHFSKQTFSQLLQNLC